MRKIIFPILALAVLTIFWNCHSDTPHSETSPPAEVDSTAPSENTTLEQLKAQAVDENDIYGRLQATVSVMQEEFSRSGQVMSELKNVSVEMDANCILTISNKAKGGETIRVDLRTLDSNGFRLIPDLVEGEYPGLRVLTTDGQPAVEVLKNGTVVETRSELVIHLVDRPAIERVTPYIVQALNICKGVQYPE